MPMKVCCKNVNLLGEFLNLICGAHVFALQYSKRFSAATILINNLCIPDVIAKFSSLITSFHHSEMCTYGFVSPCVLRGN